MKVLKEKAEESQVRTIASLISYHNKVSQASYFMEVSTFPGYESIKLGNVFLISCIELTTFVDRFGWRTSNSKCSTCCSYGAHLPEFYRCFGIPSWTTFPTSGTFYYWSSEHEVAWPLSNSARPCSSEHDLVPWRCSHRRKPDILYTVVCSTKRWTSYVSFYFFGLTVERDSFYQSLSISSHSFFNIQLHKRTFRPQFNKRNPW